LDFLIVLSIHAFSNLKTRSGSLNKKRKEGQMGMYDDGTKVKPIRLNQPGLIPGKRISVWYKRWNTRF